MSPRSRSAPGPRAREYRARATGRARSLPGMPITTTPQVQFLTVDGLRIRYADSVHVAAPGLVAASQGAGSSGRGTSAGTRASSRPGQRVGAVLDRRRPTFSSRGTSSASCARRQLGEPAEAVVEQLDVGVHERRDRLAHPLEARVVRPAPKPGLPSRSTSSAPRSRASAAPPSVEPLSTTITRGRGSSWRATESSSAAQLRTRSRGSP